MKEKIVLFFIVILISFNVSYSWWNSSWKYCREITFNEVSGAPRRNEPVDIFVDFSDSEIKPNKDSIRIINDACDDIGKEIAYSIWNETFDGDGSLESLNLLFHVNVTENSKIKFSIYYDSISKPEVNYPGIIWPSPTYDWRIKTQKYDLDHDKSGNYKGFKIFKYISEGDLETNYAGSYGGGPLSLLRFPRLKNQFFLYQTPICTKYLNFFDDNLVSCKICQNSEIIYCENMGTNESQFSNSASRNIFYDNITPENLYYRTNEDVEIKRSNLDRTSYKDQFRFGVANTTEGTNFISVITNGSSFWDTSVKWYMVHNPSVSLDNYGALPSRPNPIIWKTIWVAVTNETLEKAYERAANWSKAIDHPLEDYVTVTAQQKYSGIKLNSSIPTHNFSPGEIHINTKVLYENNPLTNLTQDNFEIYLDNISTPLVNFQNHNNGSYSLTTQVSSKKLGVHEINVKLNYNNEITEDENEIVLLTTLKTKPLIITNNAWKNYISAVSTKNPVLIHISSRKLIDKFIQDYNPDQIFQLGTNLTFATDNYLVDSRETLIKIFFNQSDLIIPLDKEAALKSPFMNLPILFEPSQETFDYLNPETIYNFTGINQLDILFKEKIPEPDYFILTDPDNQKSMFSFTLSKKKDAFVVLSNDEPPQQSKNKLIQKINQFNPPDSYHFDNTIYLALLGIPHFSVQDPVDNNEQITTDIPYCDINEDGYQDLSCGRLDGSPEVLSYQLEYSKLFEEDKTALILASYNTPGKFFDPLTLGGTMLAGLKTELQLATKGFEITRLVEKRSELDQLDASILNELNGIAEVLGLTQAVSYPAVFSGLIGDFTKLSLISNAGSKILYSIYEFDWVSFWRSIIGLEKQYPQHLPVFNEDNLKEEIKNNQVVAYFSKGNETHWFIPIESDWKSTTYQEFNPSSLDNTPLFYYLIYSKSYGIKNKMLDLGTLSMVSSTSDFYSLYSGQTASYFFKNFDQTVGKAMLKANNRNYEISQTELNKNKTYEKEYYDKILLGDPSLTFDPNLKTQQSPEVELEGGTYTITYAIEPNYELITFNDSRYLIFNNADDYIIEDNKPIIPIYRESFTLPTDSELVDFSLELSNTTYDNLELPIIGSDMSQFTEPFPEELYWNYEIELLDNRKVFTTLFSPVIYYPDNSAKVFDTITISFRYTSPIEITKINTTNIEQGNPQKINLEIFNSLTEIRTAGFSLKVTTNEFEDEITSHLKLSPGINTFEIDYENTNYLGDYSVSAVLTDDDIVVGPRYTHFTVSKISILKKILHPIFTFFKANFQGFTKQTRSFKEDYTIKKQGGKTILEYISLQMTIKIEQDKEKTITWMKTNKGELKIEQKFGLIEYKLSTPEGSLHIIKEKGKIKQNYNGDSEKLKEILNEMVNSYKNKAEELQLTSQKT